MKTKSSKAVICIEGTVQGVGFRPFVYRLATNMGLSGFVRNRGGTVEIEVLGEKQRLDDFLIRLRSDAPVVARVGAVRVHFDDDVSDEETFNTFAIVESSEFEGNSRQVSPDLSTCADCLGELFDKSNRRYRYPFLNCTNCGPRFTIINGFPYDRVKTSMNCFPLCRCCELEFVDPANRRFHAQPNACPDCGPQLAFYSRGDVRQNWGFRNNSNEAELAKTIEALCRGEIVAIKGLGGFHLACDATNNDAVRELRIRKNRPEKPFALMMETVASVAWHCFLSEEETAILKGAYRPIVLLKKREREGAQALSAYVAPGTGLLGVMMPYTPLQHILMRDFGKPLVMTSANISEEPICSGNRESIARLSEIADVFLLNDRDIISRYDDSITRVVNRKERVVRRARGYAPEPVELPFHAKYPLLAVGGHLKNSFCLVKGNRAYLSQHIGDLDSVETIEHYNETLARYLDLFEVEPEIIARDLHPDYASTRAVEQWQTGRQLAPFNFDKVKSIVPVQHHFAHIAGCMAENQLKGPVLGVAFDGIGYGADGTLWGGEFLVCAYNHFERAASFRTIPMPGGMMAIRQPFRMALSYLADCGQAQQSKSIDHFIERLNARHGEKTISLLRSKLASSSMSPSTSSCGRLFDAVASLLGLCDISMYEGHAAILLETEANAFDSAGAKDLHPYEFSCSARTESSLVEIDCASLIQGVLSDLDKNVSVTHIAAKFHETIAIVIRDVCCRIRNDRAVNDICLAGGVFQNERLLSRSFAVLEKAGFKVFVNSLVPFNDGGLAFGQAIAALALMDRKSHLWS